MKLKDGVGIINCPKCNSDLFCKNVSKSKLSEEDKKMLDPRENWTSVLRYEVYCDKCKMTVLEKYELKTKSQYETSNVYK